MSNKCFPLLSTFAVTSPFNVTGTQSMEGYTMRKHKGIDLDVLSDSANKTIVSCSDGVVKRAQFQSSYGNYVWVETNDGFGCVYAHLSKIYVSVGQSVSCKTPLGLMGNTGNSRGEHLHFGISSYGDYSKAHSDESGWINPAIWWGINNYNDLKGRTFSGEGMISGYVDGTVSTNQSSDASNSNAYYSSSVVDSIVSSGEYWEIVDLKGVTTDWLYGRNYRCIIDLGNNEAFDVSQLRCEFEIVKSAYLEANKSIITIYNLNPSSENKLIQSGQRIILEAGYAGDFYGKIFEGNIIQPIRSKENGVDYKLTLVSMDSDRYIAYGLVGVSMVAQQSMRQAIDNCISAAGKITDQNYGMQEGIIADSRITYPRGKILFGRPTYYLNQIAKSLNATYYNEDSTVNIVQPSQLADNEILDLSPETGLIGSPTQTEYGVNFSCLLNPLVRINSLIHLDNTKIAGFEYEIGQAVRDLDKEGIYRVIKVTYKGDTRGDDWKCEVEAISQTGILPSMAAGNDVYIY